MIEKKIKMRSQQKHDIEANWSRAAAFIPMAGELVVYDPDENYAYARLKVGDGVTSVVNLPFFSSKIDLTKYYTKLEIDQLIPDVSEFIRDIPEEYVTEAQLEAKNYLTNIPEHIHDEYAVKGHKHSMSDITDYVAPEIPSIEGLATEEYVTNAINTAFAGIAKAEEGSY